MIGRATFPVPSNVCPESVVASPETVKVLAFAKAVAVAAFPEVSWLPAWFTPGRLMLAEPLKETPPIVLAFSRIVAEDALPVTSPTNPLEAVTTPEATTLVKEILSSRLTVTELLEAFELRLVPPEIVKVSDRRLISSEPVSPATVSPLPTAVVVADVMRPLLSTVITGTADEEP